MYDQYMNQMFPRKQVEKIGEIYLYVIESGDNLFRIAKSFNTRMELIAALNNMNVNDIIYPGNQLLIPVVREQHMARDAVAIPNQEAQIQTNQAVMPMQTMPMQQNIPMQPMQTPMPISMPTYEAMVPYQTNTINPYDSYY